MAGLKPMFNLTAIREFMEQQINNAEDKVLQALQYEGELFVNKARTSGNYKDRTGNLRSSIGYLILKDGKVIDKNFAGNEKGRTSAREAANEVAGQYPNGFVLIGVAGMKYAAAVESKGYDVITGSAPNSQDLKQLFRAIKL